MSLKAFDLLPVVDRLEIKIVCFEACGNELYLGTDDGHVVCYSVEERMDPETDSTIYKAKMLAQVQLSTKHSVTCLGAASGVGRLLALVDGLIHLMDHKSLATITTANKFKGVTTFCLNHNPTNPDPFALEVCVGRRRCLQLLLVQEDRVSVLREVSCPEPPSVVSMDGVWACVAAQGQYTLHNLHTGQNTPLFPYDAATTPLIRRIMKEEFLLDGPGGLGMFVTCDGVSIRPPINWTDDVLAVAYHHPYILTVTPQFIRIYSVVDQQVKQTVRFSGGRLIGNFDGQVYVASPSSVYCLMPQPWHKQVQVLLGEQRVDEAVELCEQQGGPQHQRLVLSVLQRAGFLRMIHEQYNQAADYFLRGQLDPRELLHLFPGVLPSSCGFVRSVPPLHQVVDLPTECGGDKRRLERATTFALEYLMAGRTAGQHSTEVDTGIVKLLCRQGQRDQLLTFLSGVGRLACDVNECAAELTKAGMFLQLQQLYSACGQTEAGLAVLVRLLRGEISDTQISGPHYFRDQLVSTGDPELILKYCVILLEADTTVGVSLFTGGSLADGEGGADGLLFKPHQVLELLEKFPDAKLTYLHYLVDDLKLEEERYQTELALQYADKVVLLASATESPTHPSGLTNGIDGADSSSNPSSEELSDVRQQLQAVLARCQHYDAAAVLASIRRCKDLKHETASLLGRLGQHEQALRMLVHELKDFRAAEQYCARLTKRTTPQQPPPPPLYLLMLKAYLQPQDGRDPDEQVVAPLELLSRHSDQLPLGSVLPLLPRHWSLVLARSYLTSAVADLLHKRRMSVIQRGLAQCQLQQQSALLTTLRSQSGKVTLTGDSLCSVCCRRLGSLKDSGGLVLFPSGVVAHRHCTPNDAVCPLTGSCVTNTFTENN